jgi:hypothetical protein
VRAALTFECQAWMIMSITEQILNTFENKIGGKISEGKVHLRTDRENKNCSNKILHKRSKNPVGT